MDTDIAAILHSRKKLWKESPPAGSDRSPAEGGCGVLGFASSFPVEGKHLTTALWQMRNRGNGKGGGIAAVGLSAEQLGVSEQVLRDHYLLLVAYLDEGCADHVEKEFLLPFLDIAVQEDVKTVGDHRAVGLEVTPPQVKRYFVRVKENVLDRFIRENGLTGLSRDRAEDEFLYQNTFRLNKSFYYSLGEKKAFVLSHGKNMMVFKLVGYGEQVLQYYGLEELEAHVWIGHHRYPTKGVVWHPGGAHPFIGLHEALVHNGDFANYHSICEYLKQRNIFPLFLTDTEVSVLLFDLYRRIYDYPLEYVIEALAPTTEHDFEMIPEKKKDIYRKIQASHIHGSPDGPWFFIIARNDIQNEEYQLIGITDTSMLRPQVFALQEGKEKIGLIASEKQAVDAVLRSLYEARKLPTPVADKYWNARGGSYTDGGAFIYSVNHHNGRDLGVTNKFGDPIRVQKGRHLRPLRSRVKRPGYSAAQVQQMFNPSTLGLFQKVAECIAKYSDDEVVSVFEEIKKHSLAGRHENDLAVGAITLLIDLRYDTGRLKRSSLVNLAQQTLYRIFRQNPRLGIDHTDSRRWMINYPLRHNLRAPSNTDDRLAVEAAQFPPEGEESLARFIVDAFRLGWKDMILFDLRGQRFIANGLGPDSNGRLHLYGTPGDNLAAGMDGMEVFVHGSAQDQTAKILKSGKLVIFGDVGQAFMYASKGGQAYVYGHAAGRPLINSVGSPKVVINGTALDYLGESFMAGDPLNGGGFVILNGIVFDERGQMKDLETPYPGGNLFSLASGGALYIRDPNGRVTDGQLNGSMFAPFTDNDWTLIRPYLEENERLFNIPVKSLLRVNGRELGPGLVYRKVSPVPH